MSRNLRHKQEPPVAAKKSTKEPLSSDNSSDDDYCGVDLISDSEEDEPDVEVAEEQAIIESEEGEDENDVTLQPQADDDQSSWAGFDVDDGVPYVVDQPFFGDQISRTTTPLDANAWTAATSRRVRFDLSDSDSSDTEDNLFPDIFLDQSSLDPKFRQTIENDRNGDNDDPPSDTGSYWDFNGDEADVAEPVDVEEDEETDSSFGSSGYETDEGETTEEDLPAAANYVPARSVLRRQSVDSSASEEEITVVRRNPYRTPQRTGPRLGSWVTDATKPFAVMDSHGKKLMMFKAKISRRYSYSGSPSQPMQSIAEDSHTETAEEMSPMISNSANMMMSAMFTPMDALFGGQALGPPEAFYPFVSVAANGMITQDSPSSSFDEDDMDDDDLWNITDLIDFGEDSSDEDCGVEEEDESSTTPADIPSTPIRPTTANSEDQVHPLLEHLERGVVGAFRRNQTRHQLLTRNVASRESLAFSGPYRQGTLRGIKGGRLQAANTPITPMRKTRNLIADVTLSPSSPMDVFTEEKKRKFSGEQHGHKRSRSMV